MQLQMAELKSAPMKTKYRGMALRVLFVTRKCALSCCGRLGESRVTKGTVSPAKPIGRGGTSAVHAGILTHEASEEASVSSYTRVATCILSSHAARQLYKKRTVFNIKSSGDRGLTRTCRYTPRCGTSGTIIGQAYTE